MKWLPLFAFLLVACSAAEVYEQELCHNGRHFTCYTDDTTTVCVHK